MNLFDFHIEATKLKQPVRLFEAFAGIGTQAMALKRLGIETIHVGISEIDKYAIQSYMAIHGDVQNYGDITKMEEIPSCDIFTWSFPCTDLSKAGKQKGLSNTRSGLAYEVIRLLQVSEKPRVLLMENVPDLLSDKFKDGWREIYLEIEKMGYTNYVDVLNAKDYGVAQNRDRVFMVSVLDGSYEFPSTIKLEKRLKDYLEPVVDEKYYLTDKMLQYVTGTSNGWDRQFRPLDEQSKHSHTITAREGNVAESTYIKGELQQVAQLIGKGVTESTGRVYSSDGISPTIQTLQGGNREPKIIDSVNKIGQTDDHQKGGVYDLNGLSPTILETHYKQPVQIVVSKNDEQMIDENGNVKRYINSNVVDEFNDGDCADLSFPNGYNKAKRVTNGYSQAITCATVKNLVTKNELRIRKLTPLECWRLMGISDDDYYKASTVCSNSQLYKQAGNAIVVDVLMALFRNLFEVDYGN